MKKKVLIAGASGLVGGEILNLLDNNVFILKVPNSSARMDIKLGNQIKIGWNSFDARALDPK